MPQYIPIIPPSNIAASSIGLTCSCAACDMPATSEDIQTNNRLVPAAFTVRWPMRYIRAGSRMTPPPIPIRPIKIPTMQPRISKGKSEISGLSSESKRIKGAIFIFANNPIRLLGFLPPVR